MELTFTGMEVHALRETLEEVISRLVAEVSRVEDPAIRKELAGKREALRAILEKLPAELTTVA